MVPLTATLTLAVLIPVTANLVEAVELRPKRKSRVEVSFGVMAPEMMSQLSVEALPLHAPQLGAALLPFERRQLLPAVVVAGPTTPDQFVYKTLLLLVVKLDNVK